MTTYEYILYSMSVTLKALIRKCYVSVKIASQIKAASRNRLPVRLHVRSFDDVPICLFAGPWCATMCSKYLHCESPLTAACSKCFYLSQMQLTFMTVPEKLNVISDTYYGEFIVPGRVGL